MGKTRNMTILNFISVLVMSRNFFLFGEASTFSSCCQNNVTYESALNSVAYHSSWVCKFWGAYLIQNVHWLTLALGFRLSLGLLHMSFLFYLDQQQSQECEISQITQTHLVPLPLLHVLTTH